MQLDTKVIATYAKLSEEEIRELVTCDKWQTVVAGRFASEVDTATFQLIRRIQELGKRYDETVDDLDAELEDLQKKVAVHLADMGIQ